MGNSKISNMKRTFIIISAALAIAGCAKETGRISGEGIFRISVEASDNSTRTFVEGDKIHWSETGEKLNIIYYADGNSSEWKHTGTDDAYTVEDNRATFTASFSAVSGAESYTFGAFMPYKQVYVSDIVLDVPQEQTPTATSYDPAADVLVTTEPVTVTGGAPESVKFRLSRLVAIVEMTVKGINEGELIETIEVSSPAKPAGSFSVSVHTSGTIENTTQYNNYEKIILNMGNREATGNDAVWFTTVPTDLGDSSLTVKVTTDKAIYEKVIDLTGKELEFRRADIAKFSVSGLTRSEKAAETVSEAVFECPAEGAVSGNTVGEVYNDGNIKISSTGSWRTSQGDGRDAIYIGRTTSNEIKIEAQNGKTITKVVLEAPAGYLVDLKWKEYDGYKSDTYSGEWSGECKSRIVFTPAGNSHSNVSKITVEYK